MITERLLLVSSEPLIAPKPVVTQAPITFGNIIPSPPVTATGVIGGQVGTVVNSKKPNAIFRLIDPIVSPPFVATLGDNQVGTTSQQNPDSPAPTPPVGTFPPQKGVKVSPAAVAPTTQSTKRTLGIIVAGIILVWFFLGYSFRGVL